MFVLFVSLVCLFFLHFFCIDFLLALLNKTFIGKLHKRAKKCSNKGRCAYACSAGKLLP